MEHGVRTKVLFKVLFQQLGSRLTEMRPQRDRRLLRDGASAEDGRGARGREQDDVE